MNRNIAIAVAIVILFGLFSAGVYTIYKNKKGSNASAIPSPANFQSLISPSPTSNQTAANNAPNTLPASGISDVVIKRHGITTISPQDQNNAYSPLIVEGYANVFEGKLTVFLQDANGAPLATKYAIACMGDDACPFRVLLEFPQPATVDGKLSVYSTSPKDGTIDEIETISVRFR